MSDASGFSFWLLDVFAEAKHQGNQLLVLADERGTLSSEEMLAITREINFAESAFIVGKPNQVRIFTPEYEVPFAGHPTLGLAHVAMFALGFGDGSVLLRAKGGDIAVRAVGPTLWMLQPQPVFLSSAMNLAHLELLLPGCADYVDISMLELHNGGLVPEVSTGLPYLLVPVKGPCGLAKAKMASIDGESGLLAVGKHSSNHPLGLHTSLYLYHFDDAASQNSEELNQSSATPTQVCSRMFCFENGAWIEDAATGSAAGCLAAELSRRAGENAVARGTIEQGVMMGRRSILHFAAERTGENSWQIEVGGRVTSVATGKWLA